MMSQQQTDAVIVSGAETMNIFSDLVNFPDKKSVLRMIKEIQK